MAWVMARSFVAFAPLAGMVSCGPVPVDVAERDCLQNARLAASPRGYVGLGVNANGNAAGVLDVSISSDYLAGRDPSAVFNACVQQRSGQFPSRPLTSMPDWKA